MRETKPQWGGGLVKGMEDRRCRWGQVWGMISKSRRTEDRYGDWEPGALPRGTYEG